MKKSKEFMEGFTSHGLVISLAIILAIILILAAILFPFFITGPTPAEQEQDRLSRLQSTAHKVLYNIQYIKDLKTGLCFACYHRPGGIDDEISLTVVPCERVPTNLLTIVK